MPDTLPALTVRKSLTVEVDVRFIPGGPGRTMFVAKVRETVA